MAEELRPHVIWISALLVTIAVPPVRMVATTNSNKPHSRQKRLLWLTTDGRLALPPGTSLSINPTLSLPFVRHPPDGFLSNLAISLPFTINFDKLGLTDDQNPYGVLPPLFGRSMGRAAGALAADYVAQLLNSKRDKREIPKLPSGSIFHGGERAILYLILESFLSNFGMDGKACLLRAICEVHGQKMENFGLLGEVLKLFLTASRSPFAHLLQEYVDAEESGALDGECWKYYKDCSKSIFHTTEKNKYALTNTGNAAHYLIYIFPDFPPIHPPGKAVNRSMKNSAPTRKIRTKSTLTTHFMNNFSSSGISDTWGIALEGQTSLLGVYILHRQKRGWVQAAKGQ